MLNKKIMDFYGHKKVTGDVGIEVEMEVSKSWFGKDKRFDKVWRVDHDGSLKNIGYECVLRKPCKIFDVDENISLIKHFLIKNNSEVQPTIRAGVHIHLNVQDLTFEEVLNLSILYYILENPIVKFCGENRVGNLFCLRARDAEYVIEVLNKFISNLNPQYLNSDSIRYAALNFTSLHKYGSLEFRSMETRKDLSGIKEFAEIVLRLKEKAKEVPLKEILDKVSFAGPSIWAEEMLGEKYFKLLKYDNMEDDIMDDMRLVQPLIYRLNNKLEEFNG